MVPQDSGVQAERDIVTGTEHPAGVEAEVEQEVGVEAKVAVVGAGAGPGTVGLIVEDKEAEVKSVAEAKRGKIVRAKIEKRNQPREKQLYPVSLLEKPLIAQWCHRRQLQM